MKNLYLLTLLVLLSATGCKKENIAKSDEYDTSYKAWISYRAGIHNSYKYTVNWGSWTGYGAEVTTTVNKGKIISRDYTSFKYRNDGTNTKDTLKTWHEDDTHINTHGEEAGELMTIDDVYTKARTVWLKVDASTNDIIFEAKINGIITNCGYVPRNCADDCFTGINITSITTL